MFNLNRSVFKNPIAVLEAPTITIRVSTLIIGTLVSFLLRNHVLNAILKLTKNYIIKLKICGKAVCILCILVHELFARIHKRTVSPEESKAL